MGTRLYRLAAAVAGATLVVSGCTSTPEAPPAPAPSTPPPESEEAYLRERLGGLAGLVAGQDDPVWQSCTSADLPELAPVSDEDFDLAELVAQVETVRDLKLAELPEVELVRDDEMTALVRDFFGSQWEDEQLDLDTRALTALGAIGPGTDLRELRVEAFAAQVSGYYRGEERQIGVRVREPGSLSPLERVVLVHELEHALSAANLGRPVEYRDGDESTDERRASSAVVEGSATITMRRYAEAALPPAARETLAAEVRSRADRNALAGYSPYLLAEIQLPYVDGVRYLCHRWQQGGWAAVDAAYRDPPSSTAAVLFPDRPDRPPQPPDPLGDPGGEWRHARTTDFGAAELEWLLMAPGGDRVAGLDRPRERVAGWDGGELVVWTRGEETAVGLALVDRGGEHPLCDTVRRWYAAAFPDDDQQRGTVACPDDQVRLGIGPTPGAAAAIAGS